MSVVIEQQPAPVPLVAAAALVGFRGAPFPDPVMQAAAESVRSECGWHIAPSIEQTFKIRTGGADTIILPSLRVGAVSLTDRDGFPIAGWDVWENGIIERSGGFPHIVIVTLTHGYDECPKDLLGIIAERASAQSAGRVKAESLAGRSVQLEGGYDPVTTTVLNRYKLGPRP